MNRISQIAIGIYAIALIAFGVEHFLFAEMIIGRPPVWPAWLPGQIIIAYGSGLLLVTTGVLVVANRTPIVLLTSIALLVLLWAALQNVYGTITEASVGALLTASGKALTLGSGALLVASCYINASSKSSLSFYFRKLKLASWCQYCAGFFLLTSGIQHFLFVDFVKFLIPVWIPGALFWTYLAGVALAATGLSLLSSVKTKLATTLAGGMIFTWVFVLHLPRAIENQNQNEWTAVFEALAFSGILLLLSQRVKKE